DAIRKALFGVGQRHSVQFLRGRTDGLPIVNSVCFLRELAEEAHVVLKKNLNIIDSVFQHSQAVDAEAEGEAADFLRLVVHKALDRGIDHARAKEFDPGRALALSTGSAAGGGSRSAAERAGNVELDGGFGKREIAGSEARGHPGTKKLFDEIFDGAGEVAEGDVRVNGQAFDLMKDEGVSRVGIVAAINFARNDDANRGLLLFHSADLHGRSVGAKKQRAGGALRQVQIKGVHVVADGMKFGNVEGLEIVVRRFDFRAFDHGEPDGEENVFDGLEDLADQVVRTDRAD